MKKYIVAAVCMLVLTPQMSAAYQLIDTSTIHFGESSVLFTLTYQLGYEMYGMESPTGALMGDSDTSPYLTYGIYTEAEERVTEGLFSAIVFSEAVFTGSQYVQAAGESNTFTLFALYTAPEEGGSVEDYFLKVHSLPFTLVDGENKVLNGLSAGELKSYTTQE